ncbi:MAG: sensor histidine kinase [Clostridium sp.]
MNLEKSLAIILINALFLYAFTLRNYKAVGIKKSVTLLCIIVELVSIALLSFIDFGFTYLILIGIILHTIILDYSKIVGILTLISSLLYGFLLTFSNLGDLITSIKIMFVIVPSYLLLFFIFSLIDYLIKQNRILEKALEDVTVKKLEKDILYDDLKEAYEKIESITALKERNKIASEIHDTVGHTLTTVLIELEAGKRLMKKGDLKGLEKIELAQREVRNGLNSIRSSVRILASGGDVLKFKKSLEAIINKCEITSEVKIERNIFVESDICEEYQDIILSSLMEGLSNGLRHGSADSFKFNLIEEDGELSFSHHNNGDECFVLIPGFGLKSMKHRVEELKGEFFTCGDDGFTLKFTLPVIEG